MSTSEEIQAVFEAEIAEKSRRVYQKFGAGPFFENFEDLAVHDSRKWFGTKADREMLGMIEGADEDNRTDRESD